MTPADFAAELRARLDRLPRRHNDTVEFGIGVLDQRYLDAIYTALTAPLPWEEPPKTTAGGFRCSLCHQIHSATSSACPGPPAPEDGTGWVVQAVGGAFMLADHKGFTWDLNRAAIFDAERTALVEAAYTIAQLRVRRVRRQPGTRRLERCSRAEASSAGDHIVGSVGEFVAWVRELPSAPGPWTLVEEGSP